MFQGRRSIKHEKIIINELWYWVSKFMGLIYPWHRSGLCSHYLYPTNIGATQLQAPGFNRLLGRDHPRPSWTLPPDGVLLRNIIQDSLEERNWWGLTEQLCYIFATEMLTRQHLHTICRGKWSSSAAPAAPFKRPVRPSLEMVGQRSQLDRVGLGETDDKYNIAITIQMISSDKLQIIIQWFPPPGQGRPPCHWFITQQW